MEFSSVMEKRKRIKELTAELAGSLANKRILEVANTISVEDTRGTMICLKHRGVGVRPRKREYRYVIDKFYEFSDMNEIAKYMGETVLLKPTVLTSKGFSILKELEEILDSKVVKKELRLEEEEILKLSAEIFNKFSSLEQTHPSDKEDMAKAIHDIQKIISVRMARRSNPDVFVTVSEIGESCVI